MSIPSFKHLLSPSHLLKERLLITTEKWCELFKRFWQDQEKIFQCPFGAAKEKKRQNPFSLRRGLNYAWCLLHDLGLACSQQCKWSWPGHTCACYKPSPAQLLHLNGLVEEPFARDSVLSTLFCLAVKVKKTTSYDVCRNEKQNLAHRLVFRD